MFTRQDESQIAHWSVIESEEGLFQANCHLRILDLLSSLRKIEVGFACNQLHHVLMAATLARAENATDEEVLVALCHDLGKAISIPNHGAISAEFLKPYVSIDAYLTVRFHTAFSSRYFNHFFGMSTGLREQFRDQPWFGLAEKLSDRWDMPAFDPDFRVDPLESFEVLIKKIFDTPCSEQL